MMPRLRQILPALLLLAALPALAGTNATARTVLTKANANVRAKPSLSSEILVSVKKDQPITVLAESDDAKAASDEPKRWAEVALPAGTHVWVYGALVDSANKVVRASKANLRAGPGRNYADVGSIARGTAVRELRASDGWIEIEAPEGAAHGFVAVTLLGEEAPQAAAVAAVTPKPAVARPASNPVPLPPNHSRPSPGNGRQAPAEAPVTAQALTPATPVAKPAPPVVAIEPIPAEAQPAAAAAVPAAAEPAPAAPVTPPAPAVPVTVTTVSQPEIVHTDKVREVMREGIIGPAMSPQAPGDYQLNNFRKGEKMVGFLYTEVKDIKLSSWLWKRVLITGEEYIDPRWPARPVIKVTAIRDAY